MIVQDIGVMDMLLARLTDEAIDLLVMGGHGNYGFPIHEPGRGYAPYPPAHDRPGPDVPLGQVPTA